MEFASAVLSIVVIDLVLSGDNAVVIGMAVHQLPPRPRRWAILFGGGAAIALRVALTAVAALLLALPALKAVGGILLLWVVFRLLRDEGQRTADVKVATTMRAAVLTVLLADFIMSLNNVLGVAAAARGDVRLLFFGLGLSMGILLLGGSLIAGLINQLGWLAYAGGGVIAWTGTTMFLEDAFVAQTAQLPAAASVYVAALMTTAVVALAHYAGRPRAGRGCRGR